MGGESESAEHTPLAAFLPSQQPELPFIGQVAQIGVQSKECLCNGVSHLIAQNVQKVKERVLDRATAMRSSGLPRG